MPAWMRCYLAHKSLRQHFLVCMGAGLAFRLLCAYFVYGPQALDDYKHGVWPAYQYFAGLPVDLPEYRSFLLVWLLAGFLKVGSWFGATSAVAQVRAIYAGLGLLSLTGIWGTYLFVRDLRSRLYAPLALYMSAFFPLMPFVSTRAFGEAVAMSLVMLAFGVLESARRRRSANLWVWTAGFAVLGLATLFRFHVGLLYVGYAAVLLSLRCWPGLAAAFLAGLLTLGGQAAVDAASGRLPFATLFQYLSENEGGAAQYGASPWYDTWAFVLALSLAPFSFIFARKLRGLWRREWPWLAPFLLYIAVHSLVPHKEERFLYPIVGLELWALARLWASGARLPAVRRSYGAVMLGLGLPLLLAVSLINTQEGEIEPAAFAESKYSKIVYLDYESLFGISRIQFYFLRPPSMIEPIVRGDINAHRIDEAFAKHPDFKAVVVMTSNPDGRSGLHALEGLKTMESQCQNARRSGSIIDRLLYALNPRHNQRRRPTWYLVCERA